MLQVAAAVAHLKTVPLKQVVSCFTLIAFVEIFALEGVHYIFFLMQVLLANLRNISEIYGVPTSGYD